MPGAIYGSVDAIYSRITYASPVGVERIVESLDLEEFVLGGTNPYAFDKLKITESAIGLPSTVYSSKDSLSFTDIVNAQAKLLRQQSENLFLTESASRGAFTFNNLVATEGISIDEVSVGYIVRTSDDTLTITDLADNFVGKGAYETFDLTESAAGFGRKTFAETITWDEVIVAGRTRSVTVQQVWDSLSESVDRSFLRTASGSDSLALTDESVRSRYIRADTESVTLFDSASTSPSWGRNASDALIITDAVTRRVIWSRAASDTLDIQEKKYDARTGRLTGAVIGLVPPRGVILKTPVGTIELPRPEYGDTENTTNEFTLRYAQSGRTYTTVKRKRLNRRLVYVFYLRRRKERELVEYLSYVNGEDIYLTNWKGEVWLVKLLTNPIASNNVTADRFRLELEFEGIRLNSGGDTACLC
jgi:hypothetical protein